MSWYQNNQSSTATTAVGTLPAPLYWWEAGAVWGGMIDYWAYTNDTSYVSTIQQALLAQVGPNNDYMMPAYYASLGNDDQAFWAIAVLSALEYGLPAPSGSEESVWLDLAKAVFDIQVSRWDLTSCGGGLKWQIFQSNAGYDYKNSISNGGLFQIAARLAHYTGNQTYLDWADRSWDWMQAIGLIDPTNYNVYDGSDDLLNCTELDHTQWSYNPSMLLYGTAMLYNFTNGSQIWENRTTGLLEACANNFFTPFSNATDIMFEPACEPMGTCNIDQYSFKAYLSRWMAQAAMVAPYIAGPVKMLLSRSAEAAAQACSGGQSGTVCGQKWYAGGYDGSYGVGQELSALEAVQALLLLLDGGSNATRRYPLTSRDVHFQVASPNLTSTLSLPPRTTATGSRTSSSRPSSGARRSIGIKGGMEAWVIAAVLTAASVAIGGGITLV
ncbi:i-AAA protease yme1 [Teratosphaeriaceae sp. CCFEE 6253]|nr:i-AAA protease yme1 [Teratosphaeriaceae sp. CCFEE 6253]